MLVDRYDPEDVFARVPELAEQTDPVLRQLDRLLDDDLLYWQERADLARRDPPTPVPGRHSTPGGVILRPLVPEHPYCWGLEEAPHRGACSIGVPRVCPV